MWDDHYGSMSPGEVLGYLEPALKEIEVLGPLPVSVPPELERHFTALQRLFKTADAVNKAFDADRRYEP